MLTIEDGVATLEKMFQSNEPSWERLMEMVLPIGTHPAVMANIDAVEFWGTALRVMLKRWIALGGTEPLGYEGLDNVEELMFNDYMMILIKGET